MHSVGGSGLGASDKHGGSPGGSPIGGSGDSHADSSNGSSHGSHGSHNGDVAREERIRAVRRHAERAARELDRERNDSVLNLAKALGGIDRDEMTAQFEARLGFLERQVERLVGRREEVDRAIQNELQVMRARVAETIGAVEVAGQTDRQDREAMEERIRMALAESEESLRARVAEAIGAVEVAREADRRDREALEGRIRTALEESEQRSTEASRSLRETLLTSWEQTVESERRQHDRSHVEALEQELAKRTEVARSAIERIRQSLDSQVAVTVQAAHAVAEAALGGVVDRLDPEAPAEGASSGAGARPGAPIASGGPRGAGSVGSVTEWLDELIRRQHAPPTYEPPAVRGTDRPPVWEIETPQ